MMGALAGTPSCITQDKERFAEKTESEFVESKNLNPKIIAYMNANFKNWENFCKSDSNRTPNKHQKYTLKKYIIKKLKEKFDKTYFSEIGSRNLSKPLYEDYYDYYLEFLKEEEPILFIPSG
jgi:hypothetical protein